MAVSDRRAKSITSSKETRLEVSSPSDNRMMACRRTSSSCWVGTFFKSFNDT